MIFGKIGLPLRRTSKRISIPTGRRTSTADVAPLIARLTLAGVFFPHGAQKVLGWFGRSGHQARQFGWIHEIACPSENELYVGELLNWRLQKLTLKPAATKGTGTPGAANATIVKVRSSPVVVTMRALLR